MASYDFLLVLSFALGFEGLKAEKSHLAEQYENF